MESVVTLLALVPVTQQMSPSPSSQGDTETEMSKCKFALWSSHIMLYLPTNSDVCRLAGSSPTISDNPFSPLPTLVEPASVKRVTSSPTHHPPQSNPGSMVASCHN